jgi:thermolysin
VWSYVAGSLDVVAHELTHGVTESSSGLIYQNESGALNEAFSDIMGTAAEFFYQTAGAGIGQADFLIGEDSVRAPGASGLVGIRSMINPIAFGHPDHYSVRFTGTGDNGGVHINSGIVNHAFYLAVAGGTNRVSRLTVTGVGIANMEQMEKVFYRAFTFLMPANSTFVTARAATIQAARDLYPTNAAVVNAVTQAWTAVGVN